MSLVHVGKQTWMVDRGAYYLLCMLQKIKIDGESSCEVAVNKKAMYDEVLDWLESVGRAFKTNQTVHHLTIDLEERV